MTIDHLEITAPYHYYPPYKTFSSGLPLNQLYEYFTSNGLLYESQYGFCKHHSTELAALEFTELVKK